MLRAIGEDRNPLTRGVFQRSAQNIPASSAKVPRAERVGVHEPGPGWLLAVGYLHPTARLADQAWIGQRLCRSFRPTDVVFRVNGPLCFAFPGEGIARSWRIKHHSNLACCDFFGCRVRESIADRGITVAFDANGVASGGLLVFAGDNNLDCAGRLCGRYRAGLPSSPHALTNFV